MATTAARKPGPLRLWVAALFALTAVGLGASCSSVDENCNDGKCVCAGGGCQCIDSVVACELECTHDCDLVCDAAHDCKFECPGGCRVDCRGSGTCFADVGDGARVTCSGDKGCSVRCQENCEVQCDQPPCAVQCVLKQADQCGSGKIACGGCG